MITVGLGLNILIVSPRFLILIKEVNLDNVLYNNYNHNIFQLLRMKYQHYTTYFMQNIFIIILYVRNGSVLETLNIIFQVTQLMEIKPGSKLRSVWLGNPCSYHTPRGSHRCTERWKHRNNMTWILTKSENHLLSNRVWLHLKKNLRLS